ncbi:MAG: outer membrane beta-barrel protein [Bacteroidales bacterium]|nr:outer membrane beta-barrel protein [Candidatus Liminaster caballi]
MKRTVLLLLVYALWYIIALGQNKDDSTVVLNEVTVRTIAPKTKLRGDAIVTKVQGSALEKSGSLHEMLGKVPGMMMQGENLEVIGKGAPVFYVNGRKLYDIEELKRMRSEDVLEVEVINDPGAQYDATVRSVVRIRTRKPQGEGFGFDVITGHSQDLRQAEFADPFATLNFNYRHKGFDVFGMVNNWNVHTLQYATADQHIFTVDNNTLNENWQTGWADTRTSGHGMNYALGANWMVSEKHSLGLRFQIDQMLSNESPLLLHEDVYNNGAFYKDIVSETFTRYSAPLGYNLNSYYNGQWGKMGIDWNFDWNTKGATEDMNSVSDNISSLSDAQSRLLATKLVLSYPLWKGMLNAGIEMIWVNRNIDYTINQDYIADSHSKTEEDTYTAFVEYMANFGRYGVAKLGARYECVKFDYANLNHSDANVCDTHHGLYPSLSYSVQLGTIGLSLSYNTKTVRPNFYHLTDATTYASHSILMQGNSQLRNQIQHELGLNARWRWLLGAVSYTQSEHMISQWQYPYISEQTPAEEGVLVYRRINLPDPVRTFIGYVNASPTFGPYTMNWTLGYQQQFLTLELNDPREASGRRSKSYNDPLFFLNTNNTLRLKHNWQMECNLNLNSPGHVQNYRLMRWNAGLSATIQKTFLPNNALTLRLSANDILYRTGQDLLMDSGESQMYQCNRHSSQRINLSIRYAFNQTKSKYKGTGAGKDAKDRM